MRRFLNTGPIKAAKSISDRFAYSSAKIYGAFFLSFGLLSIIFHFIKDYTPLFGQSSMWSLLIGILFSVIAIPLMLVDEPVAVLLQSFRLTDVIFFEFFCIKRPYYTGNERTFPVSLAVVFGILLAVIGLFVPIVWIALSIGIILFVSTAFLSPEFSFFFSLLVIPYVSLIDHASEIFAALVVLSSLSFVRKAIFGKRVIFFEQYDLLAIIMSAAILISGAVFGGTSFSYSVCIAIMPLGYFMASNTLANRRLTDCALHAAVISAVPVSIISLVDFVTALVGGSAASFIRSEYSATFPSSEASAVFFLISTLFATTLLRDARSKTKWIYAVMSVVFFASLILTGEFFAILALLLGILAHLVRKQSNALVLLAPVILFLPYAALLLPKTALAAVPDYILYTDVLSLWKTSASAFCDNVLFGIGIGADAFAEKMADYGLHGVKNSENIFLEIGLESGIFALCAFLLLLLVRLRHRAAYRKYIRSSDMEHIADVVAITVAALVCYGTFSAVFSDVGALYLFFTVFGIGSAALRSAKRQSDERVLYFEDEKSSNSSVINIQIG